MEESSNQSFQVNEEQMAEGIKRDLPNDEIVNNEESAKEVITNFLNNEEVQNNAAYWADQLEKRFRGNSFTLEKMMKKTPFKTVDQAMAILQVLCLSGLCLCTTENNVEKFKITLNPQKRMELLEYEKQRLATEKDNVLAQLENEFNVKMAALDNEIELIKQKLPKESPIEEVVQ